MPTELWRRTISSLSILDVYALASASPTLWRLMRPRPEDPTAGFLSDYRPLAHRQEVLGQKSDFVELLEHSLVHRRLLALQRDGTRPWRAMPRASAKARQSGPVTHRVTHMWLAEEAGRLAVACADGMASLWRLEAGSLQRAHNIRHGGYLVHIAYDLLAQKVLICDLEGGVWLWRPEADSDQLGLEPIGLGIHSFDHAVFASRHERALLGNEQGDFEIWSTALERPTMEASFKVTDFLGDQGVSYLGRLVGDGTVALVSTEPLNGDLPASIASQGAKCTVGPPAKMTAMSSEVLYETERIIGRVGRYNTIDPRFGLAIRYNAKEQVEVSVLTPEGLAAGDVRTRGALTVPLAAKASYATFSVGGRWLAAACEDGFLRAWELR